VSESNGIYELEMHEEVHVDLCGEACYAMRVPGGWIYKFYLEGNTAGCVFVPYSPEQEHHMGPRQRIVKAGDPDLIANE